MKKFFTLLAGCFMAFSAFAQVDLPAPVKWTAVRNVTPENKTVVLNDENDQLVISCEFLDFTGKNGGREATDFIWTFSQGAYATAWDIVNNKVDGNGMEVKFTPNYGGTLEIVLDATLPDKKNPNMYYNDDTDRTISATVKINDEDIEIASGDDHPDIPGNTPIRYYIQKGRTYNFYCSGTKWRLKSFTFTPEDNDAVVDQEDNHKIVVVSPDGDADDLSAALDSFDATFVTSATAEDLDEYEAILVSNKFIAADNAEMAETLRQAVAFKPIVNLSADLASSWELVTLSETPDANVVTMTNSQIFNNCEGSDGQFALLGDGTVYSVTPGKYLADDEILASCGDAAVILQHNSARNTHILIPITATADVMDENFWAVLGNALEMAAKSKKAVTPTKTPTFSDKADNMLTTVTINGSGIVYYMIGADAQIVDENGELSSEAILYTEPLSFTEATILKAVALADGYTLSAVGTHNVTISAKAAAPVITVTPNAGEKSATITIEAAEEGAEIHYSFAGQDESSRTVASKTAVYTGAVTVYEPTTVYAFVNGSATLIQSELASAKVIIPGLDASNIRLDKYAHFTGVVTTLSIARTGSDPVENLAVSGNVYVGIHKSDATDFGASSNHQKGWSHFTSEEEGTGEDGEVIYKVDPNAHVELTSPDFDGWKVISEGQSLCFETGLQTNNSIVSDNSKGFAEATDLVGAGASKGALSWKNLGTSNEKEDPRSVYLETEKAFTAPFDIEVFLASGDTNPSELALYYSTDGKDWTRFVDENDAPLVIYGGPQQRNIKKTRIAFEKEGDYFIRFAQNGGSPQVHDAILYYNGAQSKEYSGIENVIAGEGAEVISVEYFNLQGVRIAEPAEGFVIKRSTLADGKVLVEKIVK